MPTVTDGFDTRNFMRDLGATFAKYRQFNRRNLPLLLEQLGSKLSIDAYLEAARLRPSQIAKIEAVPQQHNWHVRRRRTIDTFTADPFARYKSGGRKGQFKKHGVGAQVARAAIRRGVQHVSVEEEIKLRKRWAGIYQASGWLGELTKSFGATGRWRSGAIVLKQLTGSRLFIRITNPRKNSQEYANSTGYLARAVQKRIADMRVYIQNHMNRGAAEFSRPRPTFSGAKAA